MSAGAAAGAKKKSPEPDSAATAAAAAERQAARARRHLRTRQRGHGDEFLEMNVDVDPDWDEPATTASDSAAGSLGFAGTARKAAVAAAGLTTLSGNEFGAGPGMPMMPGTWAPQDTAQTRDGETRGTGQS